ncbi:hypothetical protein [Methylocystis echinoides]|uniref:hypothetical protein n=1 Tax=Methylocystis echinoides TaxID=29468 RepID=UPI003414CCCE
MVFQNAETPAPDVAGNGRHEIAMHGGSRISQYATLPPFQAKSHWIALGDAADDVVTDACRLRVTRLRRQFGLSGPMAELVAGLAFGEGRQ